MGKLIFIGIIKMSFTSSQYLIPLTHCIGLIVRAMLMTKYFLIVLSKPVAWNVTLLLQKQYLRQMKPPKNLTVIKLFTRLVVKNVTVLAAYMLPIRPARTSSILRLSIPCVATTFASSATARAALSQIPSTDATTTGPWASLPANACPTIGTSKN